MEVIGRSRGAWVVALVCLGLPQGVQADDSSANAQELFREGRAALLRQEYTVACQKLSESQKREPAAGTLLNLTLCEEHLGRIASAYLHARQASELLSLRDARRRMVLAQLGRLERLAPRMT